VRAGHDAPASNESSFAVSKELGSHRQVAMVELQLAEPNSMVHVAHINSASGEENRRNETKSDAYWPSDF
jgi:hypothetical protein